MNTCVSLTCTLSIISWCKIPQRYLFRKKSFISTHASAQWPFLEYMLRYHSFIVPIEFLCLEKHFLFCFRMKKLLTMTYHSIIVSTFMDLVLVNIRWIPEKLQHDLTSSWFSNTSDNKYLPNMDLPLREKSQMSQKDKYLLDTAIPLITFTPRKWFLL